MTDRIETFQELFHEIAYDWDFNGSIRVKDDHYSFGKTVIYKKEGKYFFEYKTTFCEISDECWDRFMVFISLFQETAPLKPTIMDEVR